MPLFLEVFSLEKVYFENLGESWEQLRKSEMPIVIYGMGNACEKILCRFSELGIACSGIFASDEFVRGQSFRGFRVKTLSAVEEEFGDFIICSAFGSSIPEVMERVLFLSNRHKLLFPDLPVAGDEYFSKEGFLKRFDRAASAYSLLSDEKSKETFVKLFSFKITGDIKYLIPIFEDTENIMSMLIGDNEDLVYADLGAYNGDTVERFIEKSNGKYEKIFAFEPDKRSFRKCVKNLIGYDNIDFINACAWSTDERIGFSQQSGRQSKISDSGELIAARSLDSVLSGKRCDIVKYDVEGAEREALEGSAETIRRCAPSLIVSAYHRPYDLIDLPLIINDIYGGYSCYLRQPPYFPAWDSVIAAVNTNRLPRKLNHTA